MTPNLPGRNTHSLEEGIAGRMRTTQRPPVEEIAVTGTVLESALAHWQALRGAHAMPRRSDLDPVEIPRRVIPYCELIEVLRDPLDFRYRLVGTEIDRISRHAYTGRRVREIPGQAPPSRMFDFLSLAVERAAPLCARLPYVGADRYVSSVENLLLPLGDDGATVDMLWSVVLVLRRDPFADAPTPSPEQSGNPR